MRGRKPQVSVDEDVVVLQYSAGTSSKTIAQAMGTSVSVIIRVLKSRGVVLRGKGPKRIDIPNMDVLKRRYDAGESCTQIADSIGVKHHMVEKWLKKEGVILRRNKSFGRVDEHFFSKIDSEAKAYWLGFISADGNLGRDGAIRLELQKRDGEHVAVFRRHIKSDNPIYVRSGERSEVGLQQKCVQMASDLISLGVVEKKSLVLSPFDVSGDLKRHYWRGFIDGDGHISDDGGKVVSLSGTKMVCEGFANYCRDIGCVGPLKVSKRGNNVWGVSAYGEDALRVADSLYGGSCVYLRRKAAVANAWLGRRVLNGVKKVSFDQAEDFLSVHHYLRTMPVGSLAYGWWVDGELKGVAVFGSVSGASAASTVFGVEGDNSVWELRRFAIVQPAEKGRASKFLAECLKMFSSDRPAARAVISYADGGVGHLGTIYLAVGGWYVGSSEQLHAVTEDGERLQVGRHISNPKLDGARIVRSLRHKYVLFVGAKEQREISMQQCLLKKQDKLIRA